MAEKLIREMTDDAGNRMFYSGGNVISENTGKTFAEYTAFLDRFGVSKNGNLVFDDTVLDDTTGLAISGSLSKSPAYNDRIVMLVSKFGDRELPEGMAMLCQHVVSVLRSPLVLDDGTEIPEGTTVIIMPETASECVRTPDGKSLADVWNSIERTGHSHPDYEKVIAGYQAQLARFSERLNEMELWATEMGYSVPPAETQQDNT